MIAIAEVPIPGSVLYDQDQFLWYGWSSNNAEVAWQLDN